MGRKPKPAEVRARFSTVRTSGATLQQAAAAVGCRGRPGTTGWCSPAAGGRRPRRAKSRRALRLSLEERVSPRPRTQLQRLHLCSYAAPGWPSPAVPGLTRGFMISNGSRARLIRR